MVLAELKPLTPIQGATMCYIIRHIRKYGYSPRYKDLLMINEVRSNGSAASAIKALERKGYIETEKNAHRGIKLTRTTSGLSPRHIRTRTLRPGEKED